jgi:hypothetical protein
MGSVAISLKGLRKLASIDAARSDAVRRDSWTVAMAAMFVWGIQPQDDATEIPTKARLLDDALRHAPSWQLHQARRVMAEWIDDHEEDTEGEVSGSTLVRPLDFLFWCDEALRGSAREPKMLNEFLKYITSSMEGGVTRPNEHELLNEVIDSREQAPRVGVSSEPTHEFRGHLGGVLSKAYALSDSPKDRKNVFLALCELAQLDKHPYPLIGYNSSKRKVIYRDEQGEARLFGVSDLRSRKEFRTR